MQLDRSGAGWQLYKISGGGSHPDLHDLWVLTRTSTLLAPAADAAPACMQAEVVRLLQLVMTRLARSLTTLITLRSCCP